MLLARHWEPGAVTILAATSYMKSSQSLHQRQQKVRGLQTACSTASRSEPGHQSLTQEAAAFGQEIKVHPHRWQSHGF